MEPQAPQGEIIHCLLNGIQHRQKYSPNVRDFSITLHSHSPRAYSYVRDTFQKHLPCPSTIRNWFGFSDMNCKPGIHDQVLNILKMKAEKNPKSACSLSFDEMYIRQQICWNNPEKRFMGYVSYGWTRASNEEMPPIANQVIVFMVTSLNGENFQIPVAFQFVQKLDAPEKAVLLQEVLAALIETGITITNITFDGAKENIAMCSILGANLDVNSPDFKPFFHSSVGLRIFIILDVCHMDKLVRNSIGDRGVIRNSKKETIEWKYFETLVSLRNQGFAMMHKMNQKHILYQRQKMKVNLATQTLSASVANSMQCLKEKGLKQFEKADATIEFTNIFNNLFDVLNSASTKDQNFLKQSISPANKEQVFKFFEATDIYIRGLRLKEKTGRFSDITKSSRKTAFNGFITNMKSVRLMYEDYVEDLGIMPNLPTYYLSQDFLEMFFGKNRGCYGYNDNPTVQDFCASYRKLLVCDTVMGSKNANCVSQFDFISKPISNIFTISSHRATIGRVSDEEFNAPIPEELEELYSELADIEEMERNGLHHGLSDLTVAYIASDIEKRMKNAVKYCARCVNIFDENEKIERLFTSLHLGNSIEAPCETTFSICKHADRFMKIQLLTGSINFNTLHYAIFEQIDINNMFTATDFVGHEMHKLFFIRKIADVYIQIRGTYIARSTTYDLREFRRSALRKACQRLGE